MFVFVDSCVFSIRLILTSVAQNWKTDSLNKGSSVCCLKMLFQFDRHPVKVLYCVLEEWLSCSFSPIEHLIQILFHLKWASSLTSIDEHSRWNSCLQSGLHTITEHTFVNRLFFLKKVGKKRSSAKMCLWTLTVKQH